MVAKTNGLLEAHFDHSLNCSYVTDKDIHTVVWSLNSLIIFQLNVTLSTAQGTPYWIIHSPLWFTGYDNDTFNECLSTVGDNNQSNRSRIPQYATMDCLVSIPHDRLDDDVWINRWIGPSDDKDSLHRD
ncbi:hypothetical protein RCL_jg12321.t1 [Rhizophagus clarus]|uniref:Uncharacterized protein n=1 Tax=Rhizophagus clarus TaxID=94130 RepID=A0A8H3L228_9GLOM|nr:hypothetical protein RCL_jg12321.t1 [Rhizophagus clarus]